MSSSPGGVNLPVTIAGVNDIVRHLRRNVIFSGSMKTRSLIASALVALLFLSPEALGEPLPAKPAFNAGWKKGRETGFPVPRFVSLKAASAHMRVGPSLDYATSWVYSARGLPLEITEEYDNWRRVRDPDGATGWMSCCNTQLCMTEVLAVVAPHAFTRVAIRSPSTTL